MTKYLDEYIRDSKQVARQVQSDDKKLKFNNIQSCVAVILVGPKKMTGVHLTTATTRKGKEDEFAQALSELKAAAGAGPLDAYIVCAWGWHKDTGLGKGLKQLARAVYLCDVPQTAQKEANIDVKVHLLGDRPFGGLRLQAYIREHAVNQMPKPNFNWKTAQPGKPSYLTDRDSKPWIVVAFTRLL